MTMGIATEQQTKPQGSGEPITDLLIKDLLERKEFGTRKYGEPLKAFNGRDPLVDAYQELIDLLVYLRQHIEENPETTRAVHLARMLHLAGERVYQSYLYGLGRHADDATPMAKQKWIDLWLRSLADELGIHRDVLT